MVNVESRKFVQIKERTDDNSLNYPSEYETMRWANILFSK